MLQKEFREDSTKFWKEMYPEASIWRPCADRNSTTNLGIHELFVNLIET